MNDRSAADRALARELDSLSRGYRSAPGDAPPAEVDAAVVARARERAGRRRLPTWWVPAALAATVVIAFALMLRVQQEAVMAPAAPPSEVPARDAAVAEAAPARAAKPAPQAGVAALRAPASAEADALPEPEAWLSRIEALEAEGLMQEAAAERERLEAAYPGWLEQRARSRD